MIDYGFGPKPDEIEITLFGPGCGEAIAVHVGGGAWLLVDSCIDPNTKIPASATYLDVLGVSSDNVRCIIATHWHDDHVKGIAELARRYDKADFCLSGVFAQREALTFLTAYSGTINQNRSGGARELFSVIKERNAHIFALNRTVVFEDEIDGRKVEVKALSPMSGAYSQSLACLAQYLPTVGSPINNAPPDLRPNLEAVVLHVDFGDDAILLGADLEEHSRFGWSALIGDKWVRSRRAASAYKVAHHGSHTGDLDAIWTALLGQDPVAVMTPFAKGSVRLPTEKDVARIKTRTQSAYTCSFGSSKPGMDQAKLKELSVICKSVRRIDSGFGVVRLRKAPGEMSWRTELFGKAQRL